MDDTVEIVRRPAAGCRALAWLLSASTDTAEQTLAERLLAGDKRALARAITLVENDDPEGWALVREVYPHTGKAAIVGFTGRPGWASRPCSAR